MENTIVELLITYVLHGAQQIGCFACNNWRIRYKALECQSKTKRNDY